MDPSPVQAPPPSHDVPVKTEERARPIPALPTQLVPPQSQQRGGPRYKDKFQALRERYESVISTHTEYTRAVQRATEKEQRLQAEINMLLDAALASSPQPQSTSTSTPASSAQPTTTPTPVHAHPSPLDPPPRQTSPHGHAPPPPGHSHSHSRSHSQPQVDAGNGPAAAPHAHTNGHASSLAVAPHGHPHSHAHAHGHGHGQAYPANHGPSTRAGSSVHGIPNEGGGTTYAGAE